MPHLSHSLAFAREIIRMWKICGKYVTMYKVHWCSVIMAVTLAHTNGWRLYEQSKTLCDSVDSLWVSHLSHCTQSFD